MLPMVEPSSYLLPIEANEHLISAWVRSNLRSGFGHIAFHSVLGYWGLPKRHFRAQRTDDTQLNAIASYLRVVDQQALVKKYTVDSLWLLSTDMDHRIDAPTALVPANSEHTALAFSTAWKLCPRCVAADRNRLGFSYWHRDHQLPSVAHCNLHGADLLSCESLWHLSELTLPGHWGNSSLVPMAYSPELREWSRFVLIVDQMISKVPKIAVKWRSEITDILDLPNPIRPRDQAFFEALFKRFEKDVGSIILKHLFKAYRNNRARRPNILWSTLFDRSKTVRHPVHWLVILFWLRAQLFKNINYEDCLPPWDSA